MAMPTPLPPVPDPEPRVSIEEELDRLPETGVWFHEAQGQVLFLPRTGLTVVPFSQRRGSWACVVVDAPEGSAYPVGGFHLDVSQKEIERAVVRDLGDAPARFIPPTVGNGNE